MGYNNEDDRRVDYHTKISKTARDLLHLIAEDFHISECMIIEQMIFHTAKNMKGNPVLSKLAESEERLSQMRIYERINYIISKEAFLLVDFEKELIKLKRNDVDVNYVREIIRNTLVKVSVSSMDKDIAFENIIMSVNKYFPYLKSYILKLTQEDLNKIDEFTPLPGWDRKEWIKLSDDDRKMKRFEYNFNKEKIIKQKANELINITNKNVIQRIDL